MTRTLLLALALVACTEGKDDPAPAYPDLVAGAPEVGAAEGYLRLPFGTPLAGFSARCGCFGGFSKQDDRDSAYAQNFVESTGVHVRPRIKAVWITNGDEHLVMTKADVIYSFDKMTYEIAKRLEVLTGEELVGHVTFAGNHNHSSYGSYSDHVGLYLGSDRYNDEIFNRMTDQIVEVAYEAWQNRKAASMGIGWEKDWDPNDQVYSDRRGDNNDLVVWPDAGPEQGGKDPYMQLIRMDDAVTGDPIAVLFGWGMHPYAFGERSPMATADGTAFAEDELAARFDTPVVAMHLQTSAGDASIRGRGDTDWARMESIGELSADAIYNLREATPTSSDPILLESFSRQVPMNLDAVRVHRAGDVNWYYLPYNPDRFADDVVYNEDGSIKSPIDEFNTDYGAAFCGSGDFDIPVGGMPTDAKEYNSCMNVTLLSRLLLGFFRLTEEEISLPLEGMESVYTTAARIGPLPVRYADGTTDVDDALMGFFPGETLHMYLQQWRRRALDELGYKNALGFGYSQDHEGYLLIPEDWLRGGYEPDISFWGPLAGEYIMEQLMAGVDDILATDVKEPADASWEPHTYPERTWIIDPPDLTPEAGTRITTDSLPAYLWVPEDIDLALTEPDEGGDVIIPRVQGMVQLAWVGGDPGADDTRVYLETETAPGTWEVVTTPNGVPIDDAQVDFVLGHTPDPLFPADAEQTHRYWVAWQAVAHRGDRAGLPLGTYRLRVAGHRATSTTYPYDPVPYEVLGDAFEIVPAEITLTSAEGGFWASIEGPRDGFRMVDLQGSSRGHNPLHGTLTLEWSLGSGPQTTTIDAPAADAGRVFVPAPAGEDVFGLTVTDPWGNTGAWSAPI